MVDPAEEMKKLLASGMSSRDALARLDAAGTPPERNRWLAEARADFAQERTGLDPRDNERNRWLVAVELYESMQRWKSIAEQWLEVGPGQKLGQEAMRQAQAADTRRAHYLGQLIATLHIDKIPPNAGLDNEQVRAIVARDVASHADVFSDEQADSMIKALSARKSAVDGVAMDALTLLEE